MNMKQEKIKKYHAELNCLNAWLERGMVPKELLQEHLDSIEEIKAKIAEENERSVSPGDSFGEAVFKLQSISKDTDPENDLIVPSEDGGVSIFFDEGVEDSDDISTSENDDYEDSRLFDSSSDNHFGSLYQDDTSFSRGGALFGESQEWMRDSGYVRDDV